MENDKDLELGHEPHTEQEDSSALRARNRTVMLSADVTGEVRARLAQESNAPAFGMGRMAPKSAATEPLLDPVLQPAAPAQTDTNADIKTRSARAHLVDLAASSPAPAMQVEQPKVSEPIHTPVSQTAGDRIVWAKRGAVLGFLVSFDTNEEGTVFNLYPGRLIVSSEPVTSGSFLVVDDESVSPMHAILRIAASGEIQVLDQLSENGTKIRHFGNDKVVELSGDKGSLEHGDIIMFGDRKFHVCLIPRD